MGQDNKRTTRACDYCRSRKIKCDGLAQCSRCVSRNLNCTYNYVVKPRVYKKKHIDVTASLIQKEKRKRGRPKKIDTSVGQIDNFQSTGSSSTLSSQPGPGVSDSIEDRLEKMESMMQILLSRFKNNGPENSSVNNSVNNNNILGSTESPKVPVNNLSQFRLISEPSIQQPFSDHANIQTGFTDNSNIQQAFPGSADNQPSFSGSSNSSPMSINSNRDQYGTSVAENNKSIVYDHNLFSSHSSVFLLSPNGLKWLKSKISDPSLIIPLKNLIAFSSPFEKNLLSIWVEPIESSQLSPLPSREIIDYLFSVFVSFACLGNLADIDYLKSLLDQYCDYRDGKIREPKYTYSELFLMNSALLIACSCGFELVNPGFEDLIDTKTLKMLENNFLENSLFYYHRVSVIFDGLAGISGCLLLAFYADVVSLSRASYLITATAIRQAQEFGLQRCETYKGVSAKQRLLRLHIWWACYALDKEMCYRWGHTPIINDRDVSTPPLPGFEVYCSPNSPPATAGLSHRSRLRFDIQLLLEKMLEDPNLQADVKLYVNIDYSFIMSQVFDKLLCANALKGKDTAGVEKICNELLDELETWRLTLPESIRPGLSYDQSFFEYIKKLKLEHSNTSLYQIFLLTSLHVRFHHVKMIIYRTQIRYCYMDVMSLEKQSGVSLKQEPSDEIKALVQKALNSSRYILKATCTLDERFSSYTNFSVFYPFNAFLSLCAFYIHCPIQVPEIQSDIELLIRSAREFFGGLSSDKHSNEKGWLIDSLTRCILFITITSCEQKFPNLKFNCEDIFENIKGLMDNNMDSQQVMKTLGQNSQRIEFRKIPFHSLPVDFNTSDQLNSDKFFKHLSPNSVVPNLSLTTSSLNMNQNFEPSNKHSRTESLNSLINGSSTPAAMRHLPNNMGHVLNTLPDPVPSIYTQESQINEILGSDILQDANGETLFQNMFNIPNYVWDTDDIPYLPSN